MARSLDRGVNELFLIATHSKDSRWKSTWEDHVDHVHDLAECAEPETIPSVLYSLIANSGIDTILVQNSLFAYAILPECKQALPQLKVIDLVHAVGSDWDIASTTARVARYIDTRIVISEAARNHLLKLGVPGQKIRVIQNGVDLERFRPVPISNSEAFRILFAARLDPVKRPLLLVDIARTLARLRPEADFRFTVAGDGPELHRLQMRIRAARLEHLFELQGHIDDLAPALAAADVLLVTSRHEGIPLTILEAFAAARPVIASRVGAIEEILDESTGILIDRESDEAEAFARALIALIQDPGRRRRMGTAARCRAEQQYDRRRSLELYRETVTPDQ
jgi:glycosyltransferase involved in cell wall biosynthesis